MAKKMDLDGLDFYKNGSALNKSGRGGKLGSARTKKKGRNRQAIWGNPETSSPEEKKSSGFQAVETTKEMPQSPIIDEKQDNPPPSPPRVERVLKKPVVPAIPEYAVTEKRRETVPPPVPPKIRTPVVADPVKKSTEISELESKPLKKVSLKRGRRTTSSKIGSNNDSGTRPEQERAKSDVSLPPVSIQLKLEEEINKNPPPPPPPSLKNSQDNAISYESTPLEDPIALLAKLEAEHDGPGRFGTVLEPNGNLVTVDEETEEEKQAAILPSSGVNQEPRPTQLEKDVKELFGAKEMKSFEEVNEQVAEEKEKEANYAQMQADVRHLFQGKGPNTNSFEVENGTVIEKKTSKVAEVMVKKDQALVKDFLRQTKSPRRTRFGSAASTKSDKGTVSRRGLFGRKQSAPTEAVGKTIEQVVDDEFTFDKAEKAPAKPSPKRGRNPISSLDVFGKKNALRRNGKKNGVFSRHRRNIENNKNV